MKMDYEQNDPNITTEWLERAPIGTVVVDTSRDHWVKVGVDKWSCIFGDADNEVEPANILHRDWESARLRGTYSRLNVVKMGVAPVNEFKSEFDPTGYVSKSSVETEYVSKVELMEYLETQMDEDLIDPYAAHKIRERFNLKPTVKKELVVTFRMAMLLGEDDEQAADRFDRDVTELSNFIDGVSASYEVKEIN